MKVTLLALSVLSSIVSFAQPRLAYNHSFEITDQNSAQTWEFLDLSGKYASSWATFQKHSGNYVLLIDGQHAIRAADDNMGILFARDISTALLAGKKKIRLEGWIKTDTNTIHASVWMTGNLFTTGVTPQDESFTDTLTTRPGWQYVQVEKLLDSTTQEIYFGGILNGKGKAWFDDIKIFIDYQEVMDTAKPTAAPATAEIAWLNKNVVPLAAIDPTAGNADLYELTKWTGNARIIGVGDPTHGTSEAVRFKYRLFKYLVEQKGFNTFILEDELPEAGLINSYILSGKDTAINLLNNYFFPVHRNEEMIGMIEWMRKYNQTHTKVIEFRGMDMQSVKVAVPAISGFAKQYDTTLDRLMDVYQTAAAILKANTDNTKRKAFWSDVIEVVKSVNQHIDSSLIAYGNEVPKDSINWLVLNANILAQYYPISESSKSSSYRDSCMAVNIIQYSRQYPAAKILISAQNYHIGKKSGTTGYWLNRFFDKDYFSIAMSTATGEYTASADFQKSSYHVYPLREPYNGTAENYFQKASTASFILPLQKDTANKDAGWLGKSLHFRTIGFMKDDHQFGAELLRNNYNALVFIRQTTHTHSYMLKKEGLIKNLI